MNHRQTLTAVVLTKNEARQIGECLDTIRWADEIVVIDGESTDGTPEICKRYGARVVVHRFGGDFGEERNLGIDQAHGDWILQLDADDRVTPAFADDVLRILKDGTPHAAFRFRRRNCFLGHWMRYGGWYHYSLHLFRRGKARYRGRVHHDLLVEGTLGTLESAVEHHPFDDFSQFVSRQNRYTSLEALEIWEREGRLPERTVRYQVRVKPLKLFFKMYVKKMGFREGMHGFLFCVLFAFVHFFKWMKYLELAHQPP